MQEDDRWLAGLRRGDSTAYERLVDRYEGPLYRYFLALYGDPQRAGEHSADCFADLVQALPKMKGGPKQLRPFVFAVARNVSRRYWRRTPAESLPLEHANHVPFPAPSPADVAEQREDLGRLWEALNELDADTREVFLLRYLEQLPLADVATIVGEPLGTVKSRLHRGRQQLSERINRTEKP